MTVVFVHAHPDDEAIFTGGTMVRLAATGVQVVLVIATGGELGTVRPGHGGDDAVDLAAVRRAECAAAAAHLDVVRVEHLGYHDSGMAGDAANDAAGAFCRVDVDAAAAGLASILTAVGATAVVGYDDDGIYGHPDHVQVTRVVRAAAAIAGVATVYGATVDREYLHFVESHVVAEAGLVDDLGLVRSRIGVATVEVAVTVDVRDVLAAKRAAIGAHASQIPESSSVLQLPDDHFADVYGWEWFVRWGPPGPFELL
ncbi:MAG: PIG-L family deacetylase [Ilumatobacteraceae bacterium]